MTIRMSPRLLPIGVFHIDTNLINGRQKLADVNQLEKWADDTVILLNMSGTAHLEAQAGNNPARIQKANQHIYTVTPAVEASDPRYRQVENALFPRGAQTESERNDVRIVCDAAHYAATLVTGDGASKRQPGGILGNRWVIATGLRTSRGWGAMLRPHRESGALCGPRKGSASRAAVLVSAPTRGDLAVYPRPGLRAPDLTLPGPRESEGRGVPNEAAGRSHVVSATYPQQAMKPYRFRGPFV